MRKRMNKSSYCDATGLMAFWVCQVKGSIPGLAKWIKDPGLLQMWLRADPWPGNSTCLGADK